MWTFLFIFILNYLLVGSELVNIQKPKCNYNNIVDVLQIN